MFDYQIYKIMKKFKKTVSLIIILLFLYLLFWPVNIHPKVWITKSAPSLTGKYQKNNKLSKVSVLFKTCKASEDVAIDSLGNIYGGCQDGKIVKFKIGKTKGNVLVNTGGRPLGMDFDSNGNLIVADAYQGIISVAPNGKITKLTQGIEGVKFGFPDDLEVAPNGIIYFTDASSKFPFRSYKDDILEHGANGAFYSYNPKSKETKKLIDSMYFANGVAVDPEGNFVLINETSAYRIRKYWLKGDKAGTNEILIENLPGFNDGISRGKNGVFWVALVSPRNPMLDKLMPKPFIRKIMSRLPDFMNPKPTNYGFVLGIDKNGKILYNFQDPNGKFAQISSVQEFGDNLYLGSLTYDGIGVFSLKQ